MLRALASSGRVLELNTASPLVSVGLRAGGARKAARRCRSAATRTCPAVGERFGEAAVAEAAGFRPGRDPFDFWRC